MKMNRAGRVVGGVSLMAGLMCVGAHGQTGDSRSVTEPVFPAVCSTLSAALTISGGEPSSETALDTSRIQTALTGCTNGQAVELSASGSNNAFLMGPINIPNGVTLIVDGGVTVFASRNPADYQVGTVSGSQDACGTDGNNGNGCNPLIKINNNSSSTGSGIMGYGIINGRGQDTLLVGGVAQSYSWWDLARNAQTLGNSQNNFVMVAAQHASTFTLYKISLLNSPTFHVTWKSSGNGFTAWGVKISTPYTARNTDGIDPDGANVTIANSYISDGDDNVAVGASSASTNISILNDHFYSGHGMSVGSFTQGGLNNMLVDHVNFSGTVGDGNATGIRLKSALDRGGLIQNVTYSNICIQNIAYPIQFNPFYNANTGTLYPQFSNIKLQNVHVLTNGKVQLDGYDVNHPTTLTMDNVVFDTLTQANITPAPQYITITLGPGEVYPSLLQTQTGTGVVYSGSAAVSNASAYSCTGAFPTIFGELWLGNAASNNKQSLSVTNPASFNLNAMVNTAYSQLTYSTWTGVATPTAAVNFYEGATLVGSGTFGTNGTLATATITNASVGTHTYTAQYAGDGNYSALAFGSVTVTVAAGAASKVGFTTPPTSTLVYGNATSNVVVAVQDGAGDTITTSSATISLVVTATGYTHTYTANAASGLATFTLPAVLNVGSYTYTASTGVLTQATAGESVTKAVLSAAAQPTTRVYGAANVLAYAVTGFVNGDTAAVVSGAPALSTPALRISSPGIYTVFETVGTLGATNYSFTTANSTMTVTGGAAQVITFRKLPNFTHTVTVQLTARSSSGLPITYAVVSGPATVSGHALTITGAGAVTVSAAQAGNGNFGAATTVQQSFTAQ